MAGQTQDFQQKDHINPELLRLELQLLPLSGSCAGPFKNAVEGQ